MREDGLIAIHSLSPTNLLSMVKMGALPAPSIAITRPDLFYNGADYGEASVVFRSDTINPATDSRNKLYEDDAATPWIDDSWIDQDGTVDGKTGTDASDALVDKMFPWYKMDKLNDDVG